eukprot:scaffold2146_cov196-Chaetoceros_neogracile.AAC.2
MPLETDSSLYILKCCYAYSCLGFLGFGLGWFSGEGTGLYGGIIDWVLGIVGWFWLSILILRTLQLTCMAFSAVRNVVQFAAVLLMLAGVIDIAMNGPLVLVFLPLPSVSVLCIISCTKKIVELIRLINFRENGIPVEGQVYNRRRSESRGDKGTYYYYYLSVVYDVPRLNTHTTCAAATSAKYESLKKTSSLNEVDETIFTETEQKKKDFNVSKTTYEAVNRSGNDSIEVLVLPGRAGYAVISQNLCWDRQISCVWAAFYLLIGLISGVLGMKPFFWFFDDDTYSPLYYYDSVANYPWHVNFSYAYVTIFTLFLATNVSWSEEEEVEQEPTNDGSAGNNGSGTTNQHELVTLRTDDTTVVTEMMSICTDDADSMSGATAKISIQLDNDIGLHELCERDSNDNDSRVGWP